MRLLTLTALTAAASLAAAQDAPTITWAKLPAEPPRRSELHDSATDLPMPDAPSTDPAMRTPLPVEMAEFGTYLPEGFALVVPFAGSHEISNGYGYQSVGWTHSTIGNENSANDYFANDFRMPEGTPILAIAPGQILTSNHRSDSYGNYVVIDHGQGITSIYAHMSSREFEVMAGSPEVHVEAGQRIGLSGQTGTTTGPHLHFAVHTGAHQSTSGADVGGLATVPEPLSGLYGLREEHVLEGTERMVP